MLQHIQEACHALSAAARLRYLGAILHHVDAPTPGHPHDSSWETLNDRKCICGYVALMHNRAARARSAAARLKSPQVCCHPA